MPGPGIDPSQDQDFQKASPQDQHAYLISVDPNYAKASPEDQKAYLGFVTQGRGAQSQPKPSAWEMGKKAVADFGVGALKGAGHTLAGLSPLINKIPYVGETLAPSAGIKAWDQVTKPEGTAQKVGHFTEQAAEFLLPTGAEEKGAAALAEHAPQLGKWALPAARVGLGAASSGAVNKLQGGSFISGAAAGGASGVIGEAARAAAPSLAESALHISDRMRGRGKTIGEAVLDETKGVRPGTIATQAGQALKQLTGKMEQGVERATQQGALGTTLPARQALTDAIDKLPRNARTIRAKMESLGDLLDLDNAGAVRVQHTPSELLEMKRGIGKEMDSWPPEWQKMGDVKKLQQRLYGAIDGEVDRLVPGNAEINQRISSLIPASKQAMRLSDGASMGQRVAHRMAAHTGALAGAGIGSGIGYEEGGRKGAIAGGIAGVVLPEMIASPTAQMSAARMMNAAGKPAVSRSLVPFMRAAAQELKRKPEGDEGQ